MKTGILSAIGALILAALVVLIVQASKLSANTEGLASDRQQEAALAEVEVTARELERLSITEGEKWRKAFDAFYEAKQRAESAGATAAEIELAGQRGQAD